MGRCLAPLAGLLAGRNRVSAMLHFGGDLERLLAGEVRGEVAMHAETEPALAAAHRLAVAVAIGDRAGGQAAGHEADRVYVGDEFSRLQAVDRRLTDFLAHGCLACLCARAHNLAPI